jgi:hypothetical protein
MLLCLRREDRRHDRGHEALSMRFVTQAQQKSCLRAGRLMFSYCVPGSRKSGEADLDHDIELSVRLKATGERFDPATAYREFAY